MSDERPERPRRPPSASELTPRPIVPNMSPDRASLNRALVDTMVEINRRDTPPEVVDQRAAKRYSISELNAMHADAIRERIERLPRIDNRPGVVRFLDVIDLPRNAVANVIASAITPEVRAKQNESGDFGTFGLERVYASDILRGLGLNNNVVAAVAGFGLDTVMDPVSWLTAGTGGLAVKGGTTGARVALGSTGQRALRGGLRQLSRGGLDAVTDPTTRNLFETTVAARNIKSGDDIAGRVSEELLGSVRVPRGTSVLERTAGKAGRVNLADLTYDVASRPGLSAAEAAQVRAAGEFVGKYTLNRGRRLGTANAPAGTALAHIPMTDITVYAPAFTKTGRQRVAQRAVALAQEGKAPESRAFAALQGHMGEISRITQEMSKLADEHAMVSARADALGIADTGELDDVLGILSERMNELKAELHGGADPIDEALGVAGDRVPGAIERFTETRNSILSDPNAFTKVENIGDLLATMHAVRELEVAAGVADAQRRWSDTSKLIPRATVEDIALARNIRAGREAVIESARQTVRRSLEERLAQVGEPGVGRGSKAGVKQTLKDRDRLMDPGVTRRQTDPEASFRGQADYIAKTPDPNYSDHDRILARSFVMDEEGRLGRVAYANPTTLKVGDTWMLGDADVMVTRVDPDAFPIGEVEIRLTRPERRTETMAETANFPGMSNVTSEALDETYTIPLDARNVIPANPGTIARSEADEIRSILADDIQTFIDDLAPTDVRRAAYDRIVSSMREVKQARLERLINMSESDLNAFNAAADAINESVTLAYEMANVAKRPISESLTRDQRWIVDTAMRNLGLDTDVVGAMPLASASAALRSTGQIHAAAVLDNFGVWAAQSFGAVDPMLQRQSDAAAAWARIRSIVRNGGAADAAAKRTVLEFLHGSPEGGRFSKGLRPIAKSYNVSGEDVRALEAVVTMMASAKSDIDYGKFALMDLAGQPTEIVELITRARNVIAANPGLQKDLEGLAGEMLDLFNAQGRRALLDGDLNLLASTPLPAQLTRRAANRAQANQALLTRGGADFKPGEIKQAFQRPRGTTLITFTDTQGNQRSLMDLEFDVFDPKRFGPNDAGGYDVIDEYRALYGDEVADDILDAVETVAEFRRANPEITDDLVRAQLFGKALDPFTLNRMAEEGRFRALLGGDLGGMAVWETSAMELIANRSRSDRVAQAVRGAEDVTRPFALNVPPDVVARQADGASIELSNGLKVEVIGAPERGKRRLRVGGQTYRQVDETAIKRLADGPFPELLNRFNGFYPEQLATQIERMSQMMRPENFNKILRVADGFNSAWRVSTLAHPSWTVVNAVGNAMLLSMAHLTASPQKFAELSRKVALSTKIRASINSPEALSKINIRVAEREMTALDLVELATEQRVIGGSYPREVMEHAVGSMDPGSIGVLNRMEAFKNLPNRLRENYQAALADQAAARGGASAGRGEMTERSLRASGRSFNEGLIKPTVRAWFGLNGGVDDSFRLASFMQYLDDGNDVAQAASRTREAMLNFGDLTSFEQHVMRPLMPFYAWLRASMPQMLNNLATDPRYFTTVPKMMNAMEELFSGEDAIPRHMRPRWIQEQLGIQIGTNPETRRALIVGTVLPQEQALRTAQGVAGVIGAALPGEQAFGSSDVMDMFDFVLGQFSPIVRTPIDLGTRRESFTGRSIGKDLTEGDITFNEYLLGQVRAFRELGIGSVRGGALQQAFGEGVGPGVARLAIGGRYQKMDEERRVFSLQRELRDKEGRIRRAVRIAEREGNQAKMEESLAALQRLYIGHVEAGGNTDDIPRWARDQMGIR